MTGEETTTEIEVSDVNEPAAEPESTDLEVKILGPGCHNCEKLEQLVMKVMTDNEIAGNVEHVRDPHEIAAYGFVATPALVVNGAIKSAGRLPRERQMLEWLREGGPRAR